jgi:predicted metal-dependent phosphoesterase TrpH
MRQTAKIRPLLCELHAHTTWSDGICSLRELVDLYGRRGFDVLCVTDHALPADDPWHADCVGEETWPAYLEAVDAAARRAWAYYGLLVLPGLELTFNHKDPDLAAHAVAVGIRAFPPLEAGLESALTFAREDGAALVAAHPHSGGEGDRVPLRTTRRFWRERARLAPLVDRFELFNRTDVFGWVADADLPAVATGDFHRPEHLASWKTLLPCSKDTWAVVDYLRSRRPAYLVPLGDEGIRRAA